MTKYWYGDPERVVSSEQHRDGKAVDAELDDRAKIGSIRAERLAQLKELVSSGRYHVPAEKLADHLVRSARKRKPLTS